MLIQRGMDKRQIMGVLHAQGYTSKDLETIFDGHDQENMELNQAFGTVIVPLQNMNNETRHLSIMVPLKEGGQEATGNNNEEMQTIPKFMKASSLEEEPGRHRNALAPGELEARIAQLQEEAEARFSAGPHRSLQVPVMPSLIWALVTRLPRLTRILPKMKTGKALPTSLTSHHLSERNA